MTALGQAPSVLPMTTATITIAALPTMSNDELEQLLDDLVDGTVTAPDAGALYDAALTERYREGREDRVAVLPLEAEPAPEVLAVGDRVEFREDTPQHKANAGIVYLVEDVSISNLDPNNLGAVVLWLVVADDVERHPTAPSRRRRRSGLATALRRAL